MIGTVVRWISTAGFVGVLFAATQSLGLIILGALTLLGATTGAYLEGIKDA